MHASPRRFAPFSRRSALFSFAALLAAALSFPLARRAPAQAAPPSCAQVPPGIVSWYPADVSTAEDGNATDIVSRNHGTLMNGATFADGKVGTAFSLDGVDDEIEVPDNQIIHFNTLTIDAWIDRTSTADARIVDKMTAGGADGYALDIVNNHLRLVIGDASATGESVLPTDTFVHVAGTFDGATLNVYVNGQLDGTTAVGSATTPQNNLPLHIGSDSTGAGLLFAGLIDEVELFNRALTQAEVQSLVTADTAGKCRTSEGARLIISEFRFRGPGNNVQPGRAGLAAQKGRKGQSRPAYVADPAGYDEFIELYNDSESDLTVSTDDASAGWALAAESNRVSSNNVMVVIPNGTIIPARQRFLVANADGYSLGGYPAGPGTTATPDLTYDAFDVPDDGGVALFATADPSRFNYATRLDAVGFRPPDVVELRNGRKVKPAAVDPLYREGNGIPTAVASSVEHSFVRLMLTGRPQDTDDNERDFRLVMPSPSDFPTAILGAPGPENSTSPHRGLVKGSLLDPCFASSSPPNRSRDTQDPGGTFGTLTVRRRFNNFNDRPVTRLRFRIIDITTQPAPDAGTADLRALSSATGPLTVSGQSCVGTTQITINGLTLEEPPFQPNGGGLNSTLSAGEITLSSPLPPGGSLPVQFRLGVEQPGSFRFYVIIEESSDAPATPARAKSKPMAGERAATDGARPKSRGAKR